MAQAPGELKSPPPPLCFYQRVVCIKQGVQCNMCLGEGHPSSCTTPAETNHMAGSEREPIGHSMSTSDTRWHKDSTEPALATSRVSQIKLDARRPQDSATSHGDISNIVITSMLLLVAFGVQFSRPWRLQRSQYVKYPQWQMTAMPCKVASDQLIGVSLMKLPAGLDDERVDAFLILFSATREI